ncbi:MAG: ABC transporter ATP-binding protein [Gammaproteobacteria bacterium]
MRDKLLSLENVSVDYRLRHALFRHSYFTALKNVSFELFRGETLGIIGRNGSGKSTLLRVLSGIYKPAEGRVVNYGASVSLLSLQLGFDPELSGRNNAIFSGMLLGHRKKEIKAILDEIIAFSELGDFIDQPIKTYSDGMRLRLGFSVAVTVRPDVMLIDEVLGVGDAGFRQKAEGALQEKMLGEQTVVFVSHSLEQVRKLCDRVAWLDNGQIKMIGEAKAVIAEYENAFHH